MSFLSILFFGTAFYFANARPDGIATAAAQSAVDNQPVGTQDTPEPSKEYQAQVDSFLQDLGQLIDKYIPSILPHLDQNNQNQMKTLTLNAFLSYFNYMTLTMGENDSFDDSKNEDSLNLDDIIMEFEALAPLIDESRFIPAVDPEEQATSPDNVSTADTVSVAKTS